MTSPKTQPAAGRTPLDYLILAVLMVDGFVTAIVQVLYLPSSIGTHEFPISIAVAAVLNVALVYLASTVASGGLAVLPLLAWGFGLMVCTMSTSGGSVLMTNHETGRTLLLLLVGLLPAVAYLSLRRIGSLRRPS